MYFIIFLIRLIDNYYYSNNGLIGFNKMSNSNLLYVDSIIFKISKFIKQSYICSNYFLRLISTNKKFMLCNPNILNFCIVIYLIIYKI